MIFSQASTALFVALIGSVLAHPNPYVQESVEKVCPGATIESVSYIGEAKQVQQTTYACADIAGKRSPVGRALDPTNVCGAPCTTYCWSPAGGGPDPNDCNVIADALLYESQAKGNGFTLSPKTNTTMITLKYSTCETYILDQTSPTNQYGGNLTYCLTDWSALVNDIAFGCQATQNAHGGLCVANDGRWYVQVQHV